MEKTLFEEGGVRYYVRRLYDSDILYKETEEKTIVLGVVYRSAKRFVYLDDMHFEKEK